MDHSGRLGRLRAQLDDAHLDWLLVTHLANVRYLSGFTGSAAALLVGERGATLFTDGRYRTQAADEVRNSREGARGGDMKISIAAKSPAMAAAEWLARQRKKPDGVRMGIEGESISAALRDRLAAELRGKARLRAAPPLIERARMVKDAAEIELIRRACELGASLFDVARETIRPGATEVEVAAAMEHRARSGGAEGMAFSTIIAAGGRSAMAHGRASAARIPAGGFVVCDFGVILAGYCSDRTRTAHVGRVSDESRRVYEAVLEAQMAAISAVRPGATCAEIDGAARRALRRHKLARYFTHSTGHGLGLDIHEAPRVAAGQSQRLEPGMAITIEPGVYVPGKLGVRIEDVVVVTGSGCEVLAPGDKELVSF